MGVSRRCRFALGPCAGTAVVVVVVVAVECCDDDTDVDKCLDWLCDGVLRFGGRTFGGGPVVGVGGEG